MLHANPPAMIVPLDSLHVADVAVAGGKAANLGELTRAGVPVVEGFVITAPAYFRFIELTGLHEPIAGLLHGLDVANRPAQASAAERIQALVTGAVMPQEFAAEISAAYQDLGEGPVAVRSSATAEDLADASFAGQQETFLNVEGADHVVSSVQKCWASLFEDRAIAYRARAGHDHLEVGIAVVVQRMVQSERSGVMFTLHPVTNDRTHILIEAVFGLGEAIVSGVVSPDMYIVDKPTMTILDKHTVSQEREFIRNSAESAADIPNEWTDIDWSRRAAQKLTDDEILKLAAMGVGLEQHFGSPQDIEWAFAGDSFYILQSRAVTTAT